MLGRRGQACLVYLSLTFRGQDGCVSRIKVRPALVQLTASLFLGLARSKRVLIYRLVAGDQIIDRKSTRLNSSPNAQLVCRLLLEQKKTTTPNTNKQNSTIKTTNYT